MAWIVKMVHYTDERGEVPDFLPSPAKKIANYFGSIVSFMTKNDLLNGNEYVTFVKCRRRPGRKPCKGRVRACYDKIEGGIVWFCPLCDDNGFISDWHDTVWDHHPI